MSEMTLVSEENLLIPGLALSEIHSFDENTVVYQRG